MPQIDGAPQASISRINAQVAVASWTAPLPPPGILTQYNEAFPGCAERIVEASEKQLQHRHSLEQSAVNSKIKNEQRGQTMAFILALVILIGGFSLIYWNKSVLGTVFIGSDIAALVGIFLYGKRDQKSELRAKSTASFPQESGD